MLRFSKKSFKNMLEANIELDLAIEDGKIVGLLNFCFLSSIYARKYEISF